MQVFQTAGEPPSRGNMSLPNSGCNTNISEALTKSVPAKSRIKERLRSELNGVLDMVYKIRIYCGLKKKYQYCRGCGFDFQSSISRSHAERGNENKELILNSPYAQQLQPCHHQITYLQYHAWFHFFEIRL